MPKTKEQLRHEREQIRARREINQGKLKKRKREVHDLEDTIHEQAKKIAVKTQKIRALKQGTMGDRAADVAETLLGVVEQGGNNRGPTVSKIILANGGVIGEPWCGDFVAYCFRAAGSKVVDRNWASVNALQTGNRGDLRRTSQPKRGSVVCYSFSHTGIFLKWINRAKGQFLAIEGNTGRIGAVSDSLTGGDGVYKKQRSTSLGVSFWNVTG